MNDYKKEKNFDMLLNSVSSCNLCERMCNRKKVLSKYNGNLNSKVMFIAEAPGRLGAECTGIPLYGDKTGSNFELLLSNIGWKREDVFISNAVLCNPQDENGNNSTPSAAEIINCSYYLEMLINIVDPEVIVTLGVKALEALKYIEHHNFILKESIGKKVKWHGRALVPLYHMSPRATIHRSIVQQRADFIRLSHIVNPITGIRKKAENRKISSAKLNDKLSDMVLYILLQLKNISFFKLTKLLYLVDLSFIEQHNTSISGCVYLRMQEGPWIPTLKNTTMELEKEYLKTYYINKKPYVKLENQNIKEEQLSLSTEEKGMIICICQKYEDYDDAKIKTAAYMTKPMKYIIKNEKMGRNMTKIPVLYKDSTVIEKDMG